MSTPNTDTSRTNAPLRVAVVGASGIGKNHARWFHQHGCDVCAFVGSSPESVARTARVLENGFGFSGRGYHDLEQMLQAEKPGAVCISSPPPLHYQQTLACIEAGAHVLCEKPLVYDAAKSLAELNAQADELVQRAAAAGVLLGTQIQYAAVAPQILAMAGVSAPELRQFAMTMETKNVKENRSHEQLWVDLAPHPLSVLQKIAPGSRLDADSIECRIAEQETSANFVLRGAPDGETVHDIECRIVTSFDPAANPPQRFFAFNGHEVHYSGRNNAEGQFRSYLRCGEREEELPDFVDVLIGNFVAACRGEAELLATGRDGAQNINWVLQILAGGQRV